MFNVRLRLDQKSPPRQLRLFCKYGHAVSKPEQRVRGSIYFDKTLQRKVQYDACRICHPGRLRTHSHHGA
jgi:hypothetical protein